MNGNSVHQIGANGSSEGTPGLFRNPQIANKSLFVTVTTESESEDEDYDLTKDSQNEERTGSNRVASHSCSSGASAAACTDVV